MISPEKSILPADDHRALYVHDVRLSQGEDGVRLSQGEDGVHLFQDEDDALALHNLLA